MISRRGRIPRSGIQDGPPRGDERAIRLELEDCSRIVN